MIPTLCVGLSKYSLESDYEPCKEIAQGRYRSMCVHEHERISMLCAMHGERESFCAACYEIDGHECPLAPNELLEELQP